MKVEHVEFERLKFGNCKFGNWKIVNLQSDNLKLAKLAKYEFEIADLKVYVLKLSGTSSFIKIG